jgi:hypothetical protein
MTHILIFGNGQKAAPKVMLFCREVGNGLSPSLNFSQVFSRNAEKSLIGCIRPRRAGAVRR